MMPTYTRKHNRTYFYYLCQKDSKAAEKTCPVHQIPAGDIEEIVKSQLKRLLSEPGMVAQFAEKSGLNPREVLDLFKEKFWQEIQPGEMNRLVTLLVEHATAYEDHLEIEFRTSGIKSLMEELKYANC